MKLSAVGVFGLGLCLATAIAGCGSAAKPNGTNAEVVDGGTFTLGLSADPGALDPQMGAGTSLFTVTQFAYDPTLPHHLQDVIDPRGVRTARNDSSVNM